MKRPPRQVDEYEETVRTYCDGVQAWDKHAAHQLRVIEGATRDPALFKSDVIEAFSQEVLRLHNVCRKLHDSVSQVLSPNMIKSVATFSCHV